MSKPYLPNLDAVRGIAAALVVIRHIEWYKGKHGFENFFFPHQERCIGVLGVNLFFVLSGYLITYLLLLEKQRNVRINISSFYKRRILRIWPLFFLVLILGYTVVDFHKIEWAWLNVVFLTNIAFILGHLPMVIVPIWTIGIEEQFYLFWPWLFRKKKVIYCLWFVLAFLGFFWGIELVSSFIDNGLLTHWFYRTRFDGMALGSLVAFVAYHRSYPFLKWDWFAWLTSPLAQILAVLLFIGVSYWVFLLSKRFVHPLYALSMAVILLNLSMAQWKLIQLENPILNFLGKISYGMYLLHMFMIQLVVVKGKSWIFSLPRWQQETAIYGLSFGLTIGLAYLSYRFYESYFLILKQRFSS